MSDFKESLGRDGDDTLVWWLTLPRSEQRRIIARGLRRIANRLNPPARSALDLDFYQENPAEASRDWGFLTAVRQYVRQAAEGKESL